MITRVEPSDFSNAATVQVESDAGNPWLALDEIETWAAEYGFVRTSEYHPRQVLVAGRRRFRGICYRMTEEEHAALELAHEHMIARGQAVTNALPLPEGDRR